MCPNTIHGEGINLFSNNCNKCGSIPTYADDASYVITTKTRYEAQEKINKNVLKIKQFLDANSLSINLGKAEILEIMVRQKRVSQTGAPPQLAVSKPDGSLKIILAGETCRLLGGNLNKYMSWKHHIEQGPKAVLPALRSQIGILTFLSKNIPRKSKQLLANGLVISKVLYLIAMWGGLSKSDCRKFQTLLNKCARMITGRPRKTRTCVLMTDCNWLYFVELVEFHSVLTMWKILRKNIPYHLSRSISLDDRNMAVLPAGRIQLVRSSFLWRTLNDRVYI